MNKVLVVISSILFFSVLARGQVDPVTALSALDGDATFMKKYTLSSNDVQRLEREKHSRQRALGAEEMSIFNSQEGVAIQNGIYKKIEGFNSWMEQYGG